MVAVPAMPPVTVPEVPTEAMLFMLLLQVPPGIVFERLVVPPAAQVDGVPVIDTGDGLIVTMVVTIVFGEQPEAEPLLTVNE